MKPRRVAMVTSMKEASRMAEPVNKMKQPKVVGGPRGMRGPRPHIDHPFRLLGRVMKYVGKSYAPHLIIVMICILTTTFSTVQGTNFLKVLIDSYIEPMIAAAAEGNSVDYQPLLNAMATVATFYACGIAAAYVQARLMVNVSQGTLKVIRDDMFSHMETLPIRYFDTHAHGDIMSIYTNDIDTLRQMISQSIPQLLSSVVTIFTVFTQMVILSVPLTGVTIVMVMIVLLATKFLGSRSSTNFIAQQRDLGALNGFIEERMDGQKVVKVFTHEEKSIEEFKVLNDNLFESAYKANFFASCLGPISSQLGNLSYVLCAVVGGFLALNGTGGFTIGGLAAFLTFNRSFSMPISQVSQQFNSVVMALAGAERIFRLIDEVPETDEGYVMLVNAKEVDGELVEADEETNMWAWKHYHKADNTTTYKKLEGDVEFNDVDFGYTEDKMVLHNIKMFATPGQKIAFVGSTGAGKTTITNLINRFYDIQDGKIRYDGININKIKKADLRKSLGIVLQDTHLFTATVKENIRYGKLEASDEEVYAAAKLANADEFIRRLPDGYDTVLTGDGANLSQGQRQLLAIARAAIANPPVLILDEATSSIDTRTEKIVQDGMDKLMHGRTTFVIAHRLSTVRNADCIMVLEQGRIIERGNHDELIAEKGRYYQLYTGKPAQKPIEA